MSTLILLLPPQPRLGTDGPAPRTVPAEFEYVHSVDGLRVTQHGRAAPADLPPAAVAVAVPAPGDVAFQRVTVPKAPAAKLRTALIGLMEDQLLEDEDEVHLALAPGARAGEPAWVAVADRPWLKAQIEALDAAGLPLERVAPAWWPEDTPAGYVFRQDGELQLAWRDAQGAVVVPLASEMARALLASLAEDERAAVRWSATPDAAGAASEFAGVPVAALTEAEQCLDAARSSWNLRQFDLTQQRRGVKLVRDAITRFAVDPAWQAARVGLAVLVVLQLAGLNLRAWQEQHAINAKKQALVAAVTQTFPNVKSVYDAPLQAMREIDTRRAAAGRPGDGDLETLLQAAESAWPPGRPPVDALKYETGHLTVTANGWGPAEIEPFRQRLRVVGVDVDGATSDRLVLSPSKGGPAPEPTAANVTPAMPGTQPRGGTPPGAVPAAVMPPQAVPVAPTKPMPTDRSTPPPPGTNPNRQPM